MARRPRKNRSAEDNNRQRSQTTSQRDGISPGAYGAAKWRPHPCPFPEGEGAIPPNRFVVAAICGLLLLAVVAVFGQTVCHDFVDFDDIEYVYENPHVCGGLTGEDLAWAFTHRVSAQWTPLTLISLMADAQLAKRGDGLPDPARLTATMHAVNVILHAANVLVLFFLLRSMTGQLWRCALVAAVFAVHPLHVESVAWVTERKDVLSGLFGLLSLAAYVRYARGPSAARYVVVAALLGLGLMAKPMLMTWPLLFLVIDYWPLRRPFSRQLLWEKAPLLAIVIVTALIAVVGQRATNSLSSLESTPLAERIARAPVIYVEYLAKSFWPRDLAVLYPKAPLENYGLSLGAAALLALITAGALWVGGKGEVDRDKGDSPIFAYTKIGTVPAVAVGWFWFLGTLAPVIGLVQAGAVFKADRFLYLPQIGLTVALIWGIADLAGARPRWRWPWAALATLALAALGVRAWQQTSTWRDSATLWTQAISCTSENYVAHSNLAQYLAGRGQLDAAIAHYREELAIRPKNVVGHTNLGNALARQGHHEEAIAHYLVALDLDPEDKLARHDLAYTLLTALKLRPNDAGLLNDIAWLLATNPDASIRDGNQSVALAERAAQLSGGGDPAVLRTLAAAYAEAKRFPEAVRTAQKAMDLASRQKKAKMAESLRSDIRLYEAGSPLRMKPREKTPWNLSENRM